MIINLENRKVLVTGGAGFVGSNVVRILLEMGAKVTVLDSLYTGFKDFVPHHPNATFIQGDVCDEKLVDKLVSENSLIIHAAAKNIIVSTKNPFDDFQTNIGGTLNVLLAAKKHGIEKLVYTGSASVYGNPGVIPISESTPTYTLTPYAVSKLSGENYCIAFYESYDIPTTIVRYSNVYGTNQDARNPYCGVVSKFFESAMNNQDILIHGDGEQTRDFTFVDDAANATIAALINSRSTGMVFNIGTGTETSITELATKIIQISGSKSKIIYVDKRDIDNIRRRVINIESIRRVLRFNPQYTLDKGLKKTYEWIQTSIKG
jgi:UDP-glucose 4-epimerase